MSKHVLKELPSLVRDHVISEEIAQRIEDHYRSQPSQSANRLFIVFGILGSLLIGMGIVLIVAHNWDTLPKFGKLTVGFLPLLIGQGIAGYAFFRKTEFLAWREGSSAFLFFAVAISIAIVSQVYNIEGDLHGFLLTWMALSIPIMYILRSSVACMLLIIGSTWYACEAAYFSYPNSNAVGYWILLGLTIPFYYSEFIRQNLKNNFFNFISWLLVMSLTICLGVVVEREEAFIVLAYMALFSCFIIASQLKLFETTRVITNAYLVVGSLGIIFQFLMLSFDWYWSDLLSVSGSFVAPEFFAAMVLTIIATILLFQLKKESNWTDINSKSFAYIIFILLFIIGISAPAISQLLVNLVLLVLAIHTIRDGAQQNHLGILNYGLLIITALIFCRFFDTDFSFVMRGLLFIGVGIGFFAANYYMIQKRKKQS